MCHMRRDMALLGRTGGCGMSRVEVARWRLPMDIGVMCDVLTTLDVSRLVQFHADRNADGSTHADSGSNADTIAELCRGRCTQRNRREYPRGSEHVHKELRQAGEEHDGRRI